MESRHRWDYLFRNGLVIDGNGTPAQKLDVAIRGDRIVEVGDLDPNRAVRVLDISGKLLCPGFIDVHAHDDIELLRRPEMLSRIGQGITTVITGNSGVSLAPLSNCEMVPDALQRLGSAKYFRFERMSEYCDALDGVKPAVNVSLLVGHATLRTRYVADLSRPANLLEIEQMQNELERCMAEGAMGLSFDPNTDATRATDIDELNALLLVAGHYNGIFSASISADAVPVRALSHLFNLARAADTPLVVANHACAGSQNWGGSFETLSMFEHAARDTELSLTVCPYPVATRILEPAKVQEHTKVLLSWSGPFPDLAGCYLDEIATQWSCSLREAARRLQPASALFFDLHEEDLRRILKSPLSMFGSSAFPRRGQQHPALWGAFPRVIAFYVREQYMLSLERAIYKMTGLPARQFGLKHRGLIRKGYHADLVIFDYRRIADRACFDIPNLPCEGIEWVMVNGVATSVAGKATGFRGGRFLNASHQNFTTGTFLVG